MSFDFDWTPAVEAELYELPGVRSVERRGDVLSLVSDDSDAALRTLLSNHDDVHDIEVTAHSMDDAFLALTQAAELPAPLPERAQHTPLPERAQRVEGPDSTPFDSATPRSGSSTSTDDDTALIGDRS
jgi:ABC-2 type transport system ATP-binding protein